MTTGGARGGGVGCDAADGACGALGGSAGRGAGVPSRATIGVEAGSFSLVPGASAVRGLSFGSHSNSAVRWTSSESTIASVAVAQTTPIASTMMSGQLRMLRP